MDVETKVLLAQRSPTEEVITAKELRELFETKEHPRHYIGYEISGELHLGGLILSGMKIRDLIQAGCDCTVLASDWHAWLNNKFGGDWEKIQQAAKYYKEAFQLLSPKLRVVLGSDVYHNNDEHWKNLMLVSKASTLARVSRCLTIMGRKESESLDFAQYVYPPLQAADVKTLGIDIAHAGMDQRKVHMLCRDVFPKLGWTPPIAIHHHLLAGLGEPETGGFDENAQQDREISSKMSKSKPWTCIFIHDSEQEIREKISKAWCPPKVVENNGVLELAKYLVFHDFETFKIERPVKFGGAAEFESYDALEKEFREGKIHPLDLKNSLVPYLDKIVAPFRKHFEKPAKKKLLDVYKEAKITR